MANPSQASTDHGSSAMDYAEHERTYRGFLTFTKWGAIHIVVILILMAFFLL
jgi:hypothetical protein